jgi:hypothetical protein
MTIEVVDWLMWVILCIIIWKVILPEDLTEELGAIGGMTIVIAFTIVHAIVFYFFSWYDDILYPIFSGAALQAFNIKM